MNCKNCGLGIDDSREYCDNCVETDMKKRSRKKSFWGEVEKNQTTIEEFGYRVKTEIRMSEDTVVYIASNDNEETVAIKKISVPYRNLDDNESQQLMHKELSDRIRNEMEILSKISQDSGDRFVITYYDYKLVENAKDFRYDLYIRMDYLTSLGQLYKNSKISVNDLLKMGVDICNALEWCHKNGRVHNNLNLNNIFINKNERYVLGDFASFVNKENDVEHCIAPELFADEQPSEMTDIYGLGMVMYMLLNNGLPPFADSDSPNELKMSAKRLQNGEVPMFAHSVNQRLSDVVCKAISPKETRYNSVEEIKKSIEFLLLSMPEEWLEQNVNEIKDDSLECENVLEENAVPKYFSKFKKQDINGEPKSEKIDEIKTKKSQKQQDELDPEDIALKKNNKRDFWIIGIVVVVLIALIAGGTLFLYSSGNREIYSLIESEAYAVAFDEISQLYEKEQNVDNLLKTYIDACMSDYQYKRVVQAVPLFSDDAFKDTEYFKNLISSLESSSKPQYAYGVIQLLANSEYAGEILSGYGY